VGSPQSGWDRKKLETGDQKLRLGRWIISRARARTLQLTSSSIELQNLAPNEPGRLHALVLAWNVRAKPDGVPPKRLTNERSETKIRAGFPAEPKARKSKRL
jgi:hypothetical protein